MTQTQTRSHELSEAEVDAATQAVRQQLPATVDGKMVRLREFVRLTTEKRDLETQLKDRKARLDALEPAVTEQFQQGGIQSINVDGYTVYLNRSLFAGPKDGNKDGLIAALKSCPEDWSFLVQENFNGNSLKARVRECDLGQDNLPVLPEALKDVLQVYEEFSIGARKSSK